MKKKDHNDESVGRMFCEDVASGIHAVGSSKSAVSFETGIPWMNASQIGRKLVRSDVNGIGRLVSYGQYFNRLGGYYTFDKSVSDVIGGYPLGAILKFLDGSGKIRTVRSMIQDNNFDFVEDPTLIDGVHWSFVDHILPSSFRPRVIVGEMLKTGSLEASTGKPIEGDENTVFVAPGFGMFLIQTGSDRTYSTVDGTTPVTIWASVLSRGATEYSTAAMIAYVPPVSSAYSMQASTADGIETDIEKNAKYTAQYCSSPVSLYLAPGDKVILNSNIPFQYSSTYSFFRLDPLN